MSNEQNTLIKEKEDARQPETPMTCKECFLWMPGRKGYKCVLSGKKRLGSMRACDYVESRRVFVRYGLDVDEAG